MSPIGGVYGPHNPVPEFRDSGYTPTTDDVRARYSGSRFPNTKAARAEFDRWLTAHDREVREQVAREIEVEMRRHDRAQVGFSGKGDTYAQAARIARGEQA